MAQEIKLEGVYFRYPGTQSEEKKWVLNNINLSIKKGEFVAILGHNGSGKSTLARHLNGIELPQQGTVSVEGMKTTDKKKVYDIRQKVGMVFQNPDNQIVTTIVEEDVAFALENLGIEPHEMRRRVDWAMEIAGITEYKDSAPHQLSGGQKQRVAIAGVVAMRPDYLVLDEPTAMLDPQGRQEVMKTLKALNKEENITVVLITHYMEEAAMADRIVVMEQGEILMDGRPREIFTKVEELREIDLDVPQPTQLIYLLKQAGLEVPENVIDRDECVQVIMKLVEESKWQS